MKFGMSLPPFGGYADIHHLIDMAKEAEAKGWDGFFLWDHVFMDPSFHPNVDPWVALAAVAMSTSRMRIGTMVTPVARRRPWVLARQTATLDRLSNGRLILGVGLGEPGKWDFGFFGEDSDAKVRAEKLDESLDILAGLWRGEMFGYQGKHFHINEVKFNPTPIQQPRIPVWVGGFWPNKPPMRRAARWDGVAPIHSPDRMTPEMWREAIDFIRPLRTTDAPFDAVHAGGCPDDQWADARAHVQPYADAGVTWWIEDVSPWRFGVSWEVQWEEEFTRQMDELIRRGPPKM